MCVVLLCPRCPGLAQSHLPKAASGRPSRAQGLCGLKGTWRWQAVSRHFFLWKECWTHCSRCVLITVIAVFCTRTSGSVYKTNTVQGDVFTTDWNSSGLESGSTLVSVMGAAPCAHPSRVPGTRGFWGPRWQQGCQFSLLGWWFQLLFQGAGVQWLWAQKSCLSGCGKPAMKNVLAEQCWEWDGLQSLSQDRSRSFNQKRTLPCLLILT